MAKRTRKRLPKTLAGVVAKLPRGHAARGELVGLKFQIATLKVQLDKARYPDPIVALLIVVLLVAALGLGVVGGWTSAVDLQQIKCRDGLCQAPPEKV